MYSQQQLLQNHQSKKATITRETRGETKGVQSSQQQLMQLSGLRGTTRSCQQLRLRLRLLQLLMLNLQLLLQPLILNLQLLLQPPMLNLQLLLQPLMLNLQLPLQPLMLNLQLLLQPLLMRSQLLLVLWQQWMQQWHQLRLLQIQ
jgi:hypothetical protein